MNETATRMHDDNLVPAVHPRCAARYMLAFSLALTLATTAAAQNSSLLSPPRMERMDRRSGNGPMSLVPPTPRRPQMKDSARYATVAQREPALSERAASPEQAAALNQDAAAYSGNGSSGVPYDRFPRPAVSLPDASWTYQPAPTMRVYQVNDVVTIRVDEITRMMAEGLAEQRKRTLTEAILTDWIRLDHFWFRPDPQEDGDPGVSARSNNNFRAESAVESRESLTFNIAATVVDIRPNGNLVLEARKGIRVNDNLWETSLSGMCRAEDVGPDNVVLSKDLIDLEIRKDDRGQLRDGYSRGWLKRFIDRFGPF